MARNLKPTPAEVTTRDHMITVAQRYIRGSVVIPMNAPDFQGTVGEFRYFLEGEDDLLHVGISRNDEGLLAMEEAQAVLSFLAPGLEAGVVWVKVGSKSHHFYFAHDELL
jgi:hypothetical protein